MMSGRDVQPRDFQHRTRSLQQQQQQQQQQEEEEEEPHHSSIMVDLRPRGRRRAAAAGLSLGLNLDLPRAGGDDRNVPVRILDENRTEAAELQLPQRLGCTSGLPVPQRISCQPPRPLPAADPPAAGSANKKEQTTWQPFIEGVEPRELGGVREEGGAKEQSMYCKDELLNGTTELSFEELRAQRYFQRKRQERNEELKQLDAEKQQLRQQLEHKQRLLQLHKTQEAPGSTCRPQGATPFQVYDESQALSAAAARPSGTSRAPADVMPDDVFLRPDEKGLCLKVQLPRHSDIAAASERSHCKIFPESSESLTEDVILSGHQNKTLCSSPDNTNDFAGAAKMASTPHSGPAGPRAAGLTDHQGSVREEPRPPAITPRPGAEPRKKLSPIQEASMEAGGSAGPPGSLEEQQEQQDMELAPAQKAAMLDPCSPEVRQRLLGHMTLTSCPDLHSELRPLPAVQEDAVLPLGSELFFVLSKLVDGESFSLYSGTAQQDDVIIKVERRPLPWDLHMFHRLQQDRPDQPPPAHISCFLFLDGCVTVYTAPPQHTLTVLEEELQCEASLRPVVVELLQLVSKLHRRHLLHAALHTHTLLCTHRRDFSSLAAVFPADWSASVDLQLQQEVTSAQQLPSARKYISLGLLEPTAPPQLVDLVGVAETTHFLLTGRSMAPLRDAGGWTVEEFSLDEPSGWRRALWLSFFRSLLNVGSRCSQSVLSELLQLLEEAPC